MEIDQISKTAEVAAAVRASHRIFDKEIIFDDPYAICLTSPVWRMICNSRILHWLVVRWLMSDLKPVTAQTLSRAVYAESCLGKAINNGVCQYAMLSAGFDSFALRNRELMNLITVYEFDHYQTQALKKDRLKSICADLPSSLKFYGVDFEAESLISVLKKSSIDTNAPIFFSWLGTIPYLTQEAISDTLRQIFEFAPEGSQIVFDYAIPDDLLTESGKHTIEKLRKFTKKRGEPLVSYFDPSMLEALLIRLGYSVIEHLNVEEQNKRYFEGNADEYRALPSTNFILVEI